MLRFIPLIFLLISICPVLSAKEIAVGQLVSDHLDTESSTNVAFNVRRNDVKVFDVRIELASSVLNCVQVAFGRDADADGDLSPDEADLVLGWRAGRYFVEDVSAEERTFEPDAATEGTTRFLNLRVATDAAFVPKEAAFTNSVGSCFADIARACPPWLFRQEWNLVKVTRRGPVASDELCRIRNDYRSFWISFR